MRAIEKPMTVAELRAMQKAKGEVTALISLPWPDSGDMDSLNDFVSECITGSDYALQDVRYRLVEVDVESQELLVEVSGCVEDWLSDQDERPTKRLTRQEAETLLEKRVHDWFCNTSPLKWIWDFHGGEWLADLEGSLPAFNGPEVRRVVVDGVEYYEYEEDDF
jgi:hypothetical protein